MSKHPLSLGRKGAASATQLGHLVFVGIFQTCYSLGHVCTLHNLTELWRKKKKNIIQATDKHFDNAERRCSSQGSTALHDLIFFITLSSLQYIQFLPPLFSRVSSIYYFYYLIIFIFSINWLIKIWHLVYKTPESNLKMLITYYVFNV